MRDFGVPWIDQINREIAGAEPPFDQEDMWIASIEASQKVMSGIAAAIFTGRTEPESFDYVCDQFTGDFGEDLRRILSGRRALAEGRVVSTKVH